MSNQGSGQANNNHGRITIAAAGLGVVGALFAGAGTTWLFTDKKEPVQQVVATTTVTATLPAVTSTFTVSMPGPTITGDGVIKTVTVTQKPPAPTATVTKTVTKTATTTVTTEPPPMSEATGPLLDREEMCDLAQGESSNCAQNSSVAVGNILFVYNSTGQETPPQFDTALNFKAGQCSSVTVSFALAVYGDPSDDTGYAQVIQSSQSSKVFEVKDKRVTTFPYDLKPDEPFIVQVSATKNHQVLVATTGRCKQ